MANQWNGWPEADKDLLRKFWLEGKSATQVASIIGRSRNAVIGMVHRLNIRRDVVRTLPPKPKPVRFVPQPFTPDPVTAPPTEPQPWSGNGLSILEVGHGQCRAVIGSSDDSRGLAVMCGAEVRPRTSWCDYHHNSYFDQVPYRRRV